MTGACWVANPALAVCWLDVLLSGVKEGAVRGTYPGSGCEAGSRMDYNVVLGKGKDDGQVEADDLAG